MIDKKISRNLEPGAFILKNGLCSIYITKSDAVHIVELLKNRLRRITWLDSFKIEEAHECHRISKICYEIVLQLDNLNDEPSSLVCINNVSSEDIDIFLDFPKHWRTVNLKNMINDVRPDIRKSGPISPIEQDRFAKQFIDVMED